MKTHKEQFEKEYDGSQVGLAEAVRRKQDFYRKGRHSMADLSRFHEAQKYDYDIALSEIKNGRKMSCWMWYIFPQLKGLGTSNMAQYYGISDLQEAREYMEDEKLRSNLLEISGALLELDTNDAVAVMGVPDNLKLRSCMTLFREVSPDEKVFSNVLDKFFHGKGDPVTLEKCRL